MHHEIHQSAIVLVRCVPGRRHFGKQEDPGDEIDYFVILLPFCRTLIPEPTVSYSMRSQAQ